MRSLVAKCLHVIIQNFDSFMSDYTSASGNIPHKHFDFLQRRYSRTILESLLKRGRVPDSYYTFLICDHLKTLDVTSANICSFDTLERRLMAVGDKILVLNMKSGNYTQNEILSLILLIPNIQELYLSQTNADDDVLKAIGSSTSLNTLHIDCCNVSNSVLKYLCKEGSDQEEFQPNHVLKHLSMTNTILSEETVEFALRNFPSLETLDHYHTAPMIYKIHKKDASECAPRFSLTSLKIQDYWMSQNLTTEEQKPATADTLQSCALLCPKVSSLNVEDITLPAEIESCMLFNNLQEICFCSRYIDDLLDFSAVVEFYASSLKKIDLTNGILSTDVLLKCQNLQTLNLVNFELKPSSESLPSKKNLPSAFPNLTSLIFRNMDMKDQLGESIILVIESCSNNLQTLNFPNGSNMDKQFIEHVCKCKCMFSLKDLDLSCSDITISGVEAFLLHCKRLRVMKIVQCAISYADHNAIVSSIEAEKRPLKVIWQSEDSDDSDLDDMFMFDVFDSDMDNDVLAYDYEFYDDQDDDELYMHDYRFYDDDDDDIDGVDLY